MRSDSFMTGTELRELRLGLGMTQEQLADELGVRQAAISIWERSVLITRFADALVWKYLNEREDNAN